MNTTDNETTLQIVYRYLKLYAALHQGRVPKRATISAACYVSVGSVDRILKRLEMLGFVQRSGRNQRPLRIVDREDVPPVTTRPAYRSRFK